MENKTLKELMNDNLKIFNQIHDLINLKDNNKRREFNRLLLLMIDNEIKQEQLCNL